jgi:hypothetical protein
MSDADARTPPLLSAHLGWADGVVPYENRGAEHFAPTEAALDLPTLRGRDGGPLGTARVRGSVAPGSRGSLRVHFVVSVESPPGVHEGRVVLGGEPIAIAVAVTERRALRVTPRVLTVEPGTEDAEHLVVVENRGNTPVTVDHPSAVRMEPSDRGCTVLRAALAAASGDKRVPIADALVDAAAKSVAADPVLGARFDRAPVVVAPGERAALRLRVRVPAAPRGRYEAQLSVAGCPVTVAVEARAGERENGE